MTPKYKSTLKSERDAADNSTASEERSLRFLLSMDFPGSSKAVFCRGQEPSFNFRVRITILTVDKNPRVNWRALRDKVAESRKRAFEAGLPVTEVIEHEGKRQVIRKWPDGHVDWLTEDGWRHGQG